MKKISTLILFLQLSFVAAAYAVPDGSGTEVLDSETATPTTTSVLRLKSSSGESDIFIGSADPSGVIAGSIGDIAIDSTGTGALYFNVSGGAGGWSAIGTASSAFINNGNSFGALATLGTNDANALAFETSGTEKMRLGTNGRLGIGATTPAANIHIFGTADDGKGIIIDADGTQGNQNSFLSLLTLGDGTKNLGDAATLGWVFNPRGDAYSAVPTEQNDMGLFYWDGAAYKTVQWWEHLGSVGFGTASPNVFGYANQGGLVTIQNVDATALHGVLELANRTDADDQPVGDLAFSASTQTSATDLRVALIRGALSGSTANDRGSSLQFYTRADNDAGGVDEQMRINNVGNVGIGTSAPATLVHTFSTSDPAVRIDRSNNGYGDEGAGAAGGDIARTMAGVDLMANSFSGGTTVNIYTPAVKFMSSDPQFTTENPKLLAMMLGRSTETYSADDRGGMAMDFFTTPNTPGASSLPDRRLVIDQDGEVGIGADFTPDASLEIINDASGDSFLVADSADGDATPFVIDSVGKTSVGDSTPDGKFDVTVAAADNVSGVVIDQGDTDQLALDINASNTTANVIDVAANALISGNAMTIASSSTAITTADLISATLSGNPAASWTGDLASFEITGNDADIDGTALKVGVTASSTAGSASTALNVTSAGPSGAFVFRANDDGTYTDTSPTIIDDTGKVAIGTTTASARLHTQEATLEAEVFRVETVATNDDPNFRMFQGRVATTDATVTTVNTIAIPATTTVFLEGRVVARRTGGTAGTAEDGAAYVFRGCYKNVAGTATLIGAVSAIYTAESVAAYAATFTLSGGNVLLRVTGVLNTNITWHSTVIMQNVSS